MLLVESGLSNQSEAVKVCPLLTRRRASAQIVSVSFVPKTDTLIADLRPVLEGALNLFIVQPGDFQTPLQKLTHDEFLRL